MQDHIIKLLSEDGLFGFLQFSHKPIGAKLRKWVRVEVKPRIMSELAVVKALFSESGIELPIYFNKKD